MGQTSRLPSEHPPSEGRRREPWATLAAALAIVATVNALAVAFLDWRPVNLGYRVIKTKWRLLAEQRRPPVDWLVLGDSTGNQGVDPQVLTGALGGTALNLCTIGALGAWNDAWMLEAYLSRVGPPRHVLIVHTYQAWTRSLNVEGVAQIPPSLLGASGLDPALRLRRSERAALFLHRYVPLYSQDQALALLVRTPWRVLPGRRFDIDGLGFAHQTLAEPDAVRRDAADHLRFVAAAPFAMSELNRESLEALDRVATSRHIDVFLASGPVYDGLWADASYRAYFEDVEDALRRFAGAHPRFHLVGAEPLTFSAEEMQNADHVIESAAQRFTKALAARIAAEAAER